MELYNEKCEDILDQMDENSIDAVVTDPPYGLSFMGKKWDYNVPSISIFKKIYKVMKPGATLLCFAGTRTQHRMAVNIEDAGFILKDTLMWLYGSGFPKATDISKQIDESKQWNGWKSHGLKPAYEPIIMAIKPNEGSYAENALKWGVSGINIDDCRIKANDQEQSSSKGRYPANVILSHHPECELIGTKKVKSHNPGNVKDDYENHTKNVYGRYANRMQTYYAKNGKEEIENWKCHEDCPVKILDDQSKDKMHSAGSKQEKQEKWAYNLDDSNCYGNGKLRYGGERYGDSGGASRFFYCAKASKSERNIGCEGMMEKRGSDDYRPNDDGTKGIQSRLHGATKKGSNYHPTVKPIELMKYLCKMVSMPTKITILDPFMGTGTTGIACIKLGLGFIGIEKDADYFKIAENRLNHVVDEVIEKPKKAKKAVSTFFKIGE